MATELGINPRNVLYPMKVSGIPESLFTPTVNQIYRLGSRYEEDIEGNVYYYSKAGSVALIAGNLIESAPLCGATTTAQEDLVVATSSAIGDYFGYATCLTTNQEADLFADGTYTIGAGEAAQGRGGIYKIKSHPAMIATESCRFEFYRPCRTIITAAAAVVRLAVNPYKNVIQAPATTPTGAALGVAPVAVPANYYFWLQTAGIGSCLVAGAMTLGTSVVRAVAIAGAVGPQIAGASSVITEVLGIAMAAIDDTDNGPVLLKIRE